MSDPGFSPSKRGSIGNGLGLTAVANLAMLVVSCGAIFRPRIIFDGLGPGIIVEGFGLIQLVWMIPIWLFAKKYAGSETAKGVMMGTGITFLLSATCWGVFLTALR